MREGIIPPYVSDKLPEERKNYERARTKELRGMRNVHGFFRPVWTPRTSPFQIYSAQSKTSLPGRLIREFQNTPCGDIAVDEVYDSIIALRSLLGDKLGRNSLNNKGIPIRAVVHYGRDYDNAFWDGREIVFGDGDDGTTVTPKIFHRFTMDIDITAHELGHGVVQYTSGLIYRGQSGALNEHLADVIGIMAKHLALNIMSKDSDWLLGSKLFYPEVGARGIRDMLRPGTAFMNSWIGTDPQPDHMSRYMKMSGDNGGVHYNSGIPNRAFALSCLAIDTYSWEDIGRIWYKAMCSIPPWCGFQQFSDKVFEIAKAVSDNCGDAVYSSFSAAGITPKTPKSLWAILFGNK